MLVKMSSPDVKRKSGKSLWGVTRGVFGFTKKKKQVSTPGSLVQGQSLVPQPARSPPSSAPMMPASAAVAAAAATTIDCTINIADTINEVDHNAADIVDAAANAN